jgi:hypothetical protein
MIEVLTKEEMEARDRIFTEELEPLVEKLRDLCEKYQFPFLSAIQLYVDNELGARINIQQMLTEGTTGHFLLAARLLRGELPVVPLKANPLQEILARLQQGQGVVESFAEHAEHCTDCREEMEKRIAAGEDVANIDIMSHPSDADFQDSENAGFFGGLSEDEEKAKIIH